MLWNTILFDAFSKINDLSINYNNTIATGFINDYRKSLSNNDITKMLSYEKDVINKLCNTYNILDKQDVDLLSRIRDDRNRCSHLSISKEDSLFNPTPELVRSHLVHSVNILLSYNITDITKNAKNEYNSLINTTLLPKKDIIKGFLDFKSTTPESFLNGFVDILIKNFIKNVDLSLDNKQKILLSLQCIYDLKQDYIIDKYRSKSKIYESNLTDEMIPNIIRLILTFKNITSSIKDSTKSMIQSFISRVNISNNDYMSDNNRSYNITEMRAFKLLYLFTMVDDYQEACYNKVISCFSIDNREVSLFLSNNPIQRYTSNVIDAVKTSPNFIDFDLRYPILISHIKFLSEDQLKIILDSIINNNQIYWNSYLKDFFQEMWNSSAWVFDHKTTIKNHLTVNQEFYQTKVQNGQIILEYIK